MFYYLENIYLQNLISFKVDNKGKDVRMVVCINVKLVFMNVVVVLVLISIIKDLVKVENLMIS